MRTTLAIILLFLGIPIVWFFPIGTVCATIIWLFAWFLLDWKETSDSNKQFLFDKEYKDFQTLRLEKPLSSSTFKDSKKFYKNDDQFKSHDDWLSYHVKLLEESYSKSKNFFYNVDDMILPMQSKVNKLIKTPKIYTDICEYLNEKPIKELIEDWENEIKKNKNDEVKKLVKIQKEFDVIEDLIRSYHRQGFSRSDIIYKINYEYKNPDHLFMKQYNVKRINEEWIITHGYEKRSVKFYL